LKIAKTGWGKGPGTDGPRKRRRPSILSLEKGSEGRGFFGVWKKKVVESRKENLEERRSLQVVEKLEKE